MLRDREWWTKGPCTEDQINMLLGMEWAIAHSPKESALQESFVKDALKMNHGQVSHDLISVALSPY